jgi:hypothetical protein
MMRLRRILLVPAFVTCVSCSGEPASEPAPVVPAVTAPAVTGSPSVSGKAPPGTIVTLEPTAPREFPLPDGPAIMDQYAKQFVPDMLLVRVGQPVEFRNSEDSPHNVNVNRIPTGAEVFAVATAPYQKHVHTFEQPGQYAVACDIHPGMLATVVATTTPYVAVVGDAGTFQFSDLAAGEYKLRWTANGRNSEKTVTVAAGTTNVSVP